jgi:hypothetical protein
MTRLKFDPKKLQFHKDGRITGMFFLGDGTKTFFEIAADATFKQWGNTPKNMKLTAPTVQGLADLMLNDD